MAKTRRELDGMVLMTLICTSPLVLGGAALWLWSGPLRLIFRQSVLTTMVLTALTAALAFAAAMWVIMGMAMDGRARRAEPPRSATLYCLGAAGVMLFSIALFPAVLNGLGAAVLGIIVPFG